jgi:hypothetical protein
MRFRLLAPTGEVLDEGDATAELAGGALVVSPAHGQVLRIAPADIAHVGEPQPYAVRLVLAEGAVVDLLGLGAMRTRLLAELDDARADGVPGALLVDGVGRPESFTGAVGGVTADERRDAELRLYDDALVVVPAYGDADKVPYPFVRGIRTDASGYLLTVDVAGRAPLVVGRLGRRTGEFADLLDARCRAAAGRTAAFLGALLPGLGPVALRTVADLLRDGLAAAHSELDRVDPTAWPALVAAATRPDRVACLRTLEQLGPLWIGFKQTVSVERAAQGVRPWHDSAITPDLGAHGVHSAGGGWYGSWFGGYGGFWSGGYGGFWSGNQHPRMPRADVARGRLVAAHTDLEALTGPDALAATADGGAAPTIRAFALCLTGTGGLVYEVLNEPGHDTYVYCATDAGAVAALNRALDLVGFRPEAVVDADTAGSAYRAAALRLPALRLLRDAYVGRVAHTDDWARDLTALTG